MSWISSKLLWKRCWTGLGREIEHEQEVLARQADGNVHRHPDQEVGLGSTSDVSEDKKQIDDREDVGFQNNRDHQNK